MEMKANPAKADINSHGGSIFSAGASALVGDAHCAVEKAQGE